MYITETNRCQRTVVWMCVDRALWIFGKNLSCLKILPPSVWKEISTTCIACLHPYVSRLQWLFGRTVRNSLYGPFELQDSCLEFRLGRTCVSVSIKWVISETVYSVRREEKPIRCHWMVYCTYNMPNTFRALLCTSSGAQDYMCVITAYGVQCLGCWLSVVRCRTAGYASGMRDVARL